jgi:hypothetical protein
MSVPGAERVEIMAGPEKARTRDAGDGEGETADGVGVSEGDLDGDADAVGELYYLPVHAPRDGTAAT